MIVHTVELRFAAPNSAAKAACADLFMCALAQKAYEHATALGLTDVKVMVYGEDYFVAMHEVIAQIAAARAKDAAKKAAKNAANKKRRAKR